MKYRNFPSHLEIESTNLCNLSCIMCPHHIMMRKQENMSMTIFDKIIEQSKDNNVMTCYVHMIGEPLLNPNIIDMINRLDSIGICTSISTNGMLLSYSMIKDLLTSKLKELIICLDGINEQTYNKYRTGGNFNSVVKNIDNCILYKKLHLSQVKTDIVVQFINMKENLDQFKIFAETYNSKLKNLGHIHFKDFSTFAGYIPDFGSFATKKRRFKCTKLQTHLAIQSNGDFVICCRDFEGFTKVGNINEITIQEVWHSDFYNQYRSEFDNKIWNNPLCKDC